MSDIPDAVSGAPEVHTVLLENSKFRVLSVTVPPATTTAMHSHPANIVYVVRGGKLKFTKPDESSNEVYLNEGQVIESESGAHIVENTGVSEVKVIQIEHK